MIVIVSKGANDIAAERARQIAVEGYDAEHDDDHSEGSLAVIAAELALKHTTVSLDYDWCPVGRDEYGLCRKHQDTRRRLVIAGALIAAEIDRLDRKNRSEEIGIGKTPAPAIGANERALAIAELEALYGPVIAESSQKVKLILDERIAALRAGGAQKGETK